MEAKININENVYFKLTKKGNAILEQYRNKLSELVRYEVKRESIVKDAGNGLEYIQLWDFMNIFGEHFTIGSEPVIEDNYLHFK